MTVLSKRLHEAADNGNDALDHDELHAAAAVLEMLAGEEYSPAYINRWVDGLASKVLK